MIYYSEIEVEKFITLFVGIIKKYCDKETQEKIMEEILTEFAQHFKNEFGKNIKA